MQIPGLLIENHSAIDKYDVKIENNYLWQFESTI